jgi:hypothetical protein
MTSKMVTELITALNLPSDVADILEARDAKGMVEYGIEFAPHDGKDTMVDAEEEAADLLMYLFKAHQERKVYVWPLVLRSAQLLVDVLDAQEAEL